MDYYSKYLKYKSKYLSLKSELNNVEQNGGGNVEVMLFKAEWCGHCQAFKPTWNKLKDMHNKKYNFVTYDADKNEKEVAQWQVRGFPTIIIKKGKEATEYRGERDIDSLTKFLGEFN